MTADPGRPSGPVGGVEVAAGRAEPPPPVRGQPVRAVAAARVTRRAFLPRRTLPASLTAAVIAALAVLGAIQVISTLAGHPVDVLPEAWLHRTGHRLYWHSAATLAVAEAMVVLGVLLVWLALVPGRPGPIPLTPAGPDTVTAISRRGLRRFLQAAAEAEEGVASARVRVRRRGVSVAAASALHDAPGLADRVRTAVTRQCQALEPLRPLAVRVTVSESRD